MRIAVSASLVIQLLWFGILRGLWHAIAESNVHGIDKYLKLYVFFYLLGLVGGWYAHK